MLLLHLLGALTLFPRLCNQCPSIFQHIQKFANVLRSRHRAMTRNYFHVGGNHTEYLFDLSYHAVDAAAIGRIDERNAVGDEIDPDVDDLGFREEDHTIAIRMAVGEMNRPDVFAVEMDRGAVVKRNDWQRFLGSRFDLATHDRGPKLKPLAHVFVGDNRSLG